MHPFLVMTDPWIHWGAILGVIAGVLAIVAAIAKAAQWVDQRNIEQIDRAVSRITETNGGSSLRDDVKRAITVGEGNAVSLVALRRDVDSLVTTFAEHVLAGEQVIAASTGSRERFDQHMKDHEALGWSEGHG